VVEGKRKIVIVPDDATVPEHPEGEISRGVRVNIRDGEQGRAADAPAESQCREPGAAR
jgi:hypothetical protein